MLNVNHLTGFGVVSGGGPALIGTAFGNGLGVSINYPAGTVAGSFLFLACTAGSSTITTPSGWTALAGGSHTATNYFAIFYRIAGVETSVTAGDDIYAASTLLAFSGATAIGTVGSWTDSVYVGGGLAITGITPQSVSSIVVGYVSTRTTSGVVPTKPTGWVEGYNSGTVNAYFGTDVAFNAFGSTSPTGAVNFGNVDSTYNTSGILCEIKP